MNAIDQSGFESTEFFSTELIRRATMTDAQEVAVENGMCPDCRTFLCNVGDAGTLRHSWCDVCNCVFVLAGYP